MTRSTFDSKTTYLWGWSFTIDETVLGRQTNWTTMQLLGGVVEDRLDSKWNSV